MNIKKIKNTLDPESFDIIVNKKTEVPFSGKFLLEKRKGIYICKACDATLFSSEAKYDSGSGWPSFFDCFSDSISYTLDQSLGMNRIEISCKNCGGHLGHVFEDGPVQSTGKRFCVNSKSLNFQSDEN